MEVVFPFTKFVPPQLDERIVTGRVLEVVRDAVAHHPLTVVVAPAGSGKTTALAAWARGAAEPVAWVRIGSADDTPAALSAAILAGVRGVVSGFGARLEALLGTTGTALSTHNLVTAITNDLGAVERVSLVLDDAHELVDPDTWAVVDGMIEHLPSTARLVVGSRTEPAVSLPRRRVRGEAAVIGLDELRLGPAEVREVLAGQVADPAVIDAVVRASSGWAAAVRLATATVHAAQRGSSAAAGADAPRHDLDPVSAARPDLWRFLAEEVLDSQPPDLRAFLLETAILDELTPSVCAAVTDRPDAGDVLDELSRRNLFVARFAGERGPAWRYHDLFAEFLRARLHAERSAASVVDLHLRAADALPPPRAVPHLLAAGEHDRVAEIALTISFERLDPGVLSLVLPWAEALPDELVDRYPRLALVLTWADEMAGRHTEILAKLEPLHARLLDAGREIAAAEIGAEIALVHLISGDHERAGPLLDEALRLPLDDWARLLAVIARMHWSRDQGDWAGASSSLATAFDLALGAGSSGPVSLLAAGLGANLLFADQGPAWVSDRAERLRALIDPSAALSLTGLRPLLAGAALLRLDLDAAADELRRCLTTSREVGGLAWTHQEAELLQFALHLAAGNHEAVRRAVGEAYQRMSHSRIDASMAYGYAHADVRSAWLRGDRPRLDVAIGRLSDAGRPEEGIVRAVGRAMVVRMDDRGLDEVADELVAAEHAQRELRTWFGVGLPGLERATILYERGRTRHALEVAEPTLATVAELGGGILLADAAAHVPLLRRCADEGLHTGTLEAVLTILDRPAGATRITVPGTSETVSAREVEVLALVAEGRSNREIAAALFIGEVTVKSHLTRIFRKLDAASRTHAVARARELHLL